MRRPVAALALLASVGYAAYRLVRAPAPIAPPAAAPAADYDAALARLAELQAEDTPRVNPVCRTRLLTHGHQTEQAMVLLHGFTNCPNQFVELAQAFFDQGYNILIPRMPVHGLERLADDQKHLTAEDLVAMASRSIDIAHGLGERVTVFGFSMGGVLAGWCAQNRADLARVVLCSPALAVQAMPEQLAATAVAARLFQRLPNFFRWWNPELRDAREGPQHAYPRFSSRAFAAMLRLSLSLQAQASRQRPEAPAILVITNPSDDVVRNDGTEALIFQWRRHGAEITTYEFPAEWQLLHDLIDPQQPTQQIARVYPLLLNLV